MTAPSSKNVCRSLGLTQRRHLPDPLKFCPLGPTGPTVSGISGIIFFDVQNLVLCLTRELIKLIDYKIMLKLQCKTKFNSAFVGIMILKNVVLYEIYSKKITVPCPFTLKVGPFALIILCVEY